MFAKKRSKIVYGKLGKEMLEVHVYALVTAIVVSFLEEFCHALYKCVTNARSRQPFFIDLYFSQLIVLFGGDSVFLDTPTFVRRHFQQFLIKESQPLTMANPCH